MRELWANGQHLDNRGYLEVKFSRYALHRFFVEVELSTHNKPVAKCEFKEGHTMDKYAGELEIEGTSDWQLLSEFPFMGLLSDIR